MKCIECKKHMKLVNVENFYISDTSEATSSINEYDCPNCGIKIFMNMSISNYGIEKLYIPDLLKPTEKQLEFAEYLCSIMPELRYSRSKCYTKRQLSKFISENKEEVFRFKKEEQEKASSKVSKSIATRRSVKKRSNTDE